MELVKLRLGEASMIRLARGVVLLGSAWTLVCVGLALAAQSASALHGAEAQDFSIRSLLAKLADEGVVYSTASETVATRVSLLQSLLDLPVIVPLLAVAALQI